MTDTQTTKRYIIVLEKDGYKYYVSSGSHGWAVHTTQKQATSWEYERHAKEAMARAPAPIKFKGKVIAV